ncbi:hypothetical protein GE21DRAFT_1060333 [Neurospora crassa]|nr:hypothetical protein GE21DRAFT_1060333 [Neurospora crassa]
MLQRSMYTPPSPWFPMVLILPATPCQSVETVNHPVNKPVSLSQASLLRSRQKVEKPYLQSGPVAGGNALGQLSVAGETWRDETSSGSTRQQASIPGRNLSQFAGCSTVSRRTQ